MVGRHIKKRGQWWHYYRHRPLRFSDIEPRARITFAHNTTCQIQAQTKAAQISLDLDRRWQSALERGVSLGHANDQSRYLAALAANQVHGFSPPNFTSNGTLFSDADLLTRLH